MMFFDSWGGLWETCSPDSEGAVAFGPNGISRPIEAPPGFFARAVEAGEVDFEEESGWNFFMGQKP